MNNITDSFVSRLYDLSVTELTESVKNQVKLSLIDHLGCTLIGESRLRENEKAADCY